VSDQSWNVGQMMQPVRGAKAGSLVAGMIMLGLLGCGSDARPSVSASYGRLVSQPAGGGAQCAVDGESGGCPSGQSQSDSASADSSGNIDADPGTSEVSGEFTQTTVQGAVVALSKLPAAKTIAQASPTCTVGAQPADNEVCSYDYCCAAASDTSTTGTCEPWIKSGSQACRPAAGADYTAGIGCQEASGSVHIPVCNRGKADSPSSGKLLIAGYTGSLHAAGTAQVSSNLGSGPPEGCLIDLAVLPIPAGSCVDVDVARAAAGTLDGVTCASASDFANGNRAAMVNPPSPTTLPASLAKTYGASSYEQLNESDKSNNQSFVYTQLGTCSIYGVQPLPPTATMLTYKATCQPGYSPQWTQLTYATSLPSGSEVIFAAGTAPALADGTAGAFGDLVTIADAKTSGPDPAVCDAETPGCPKDISAILGPARFNPYLQLGIKQVASTSLPTVSTWHVSYTCTPSS
jgi:hypothetical protein